MLCHLSKKKKCCVTSQDIPSLAAEAAKEHPDVSYIVTAPLGLHDLLVVYNVILFLLLGQHPNECL